VIRVGSAWIAVVVMVVAASLAATAVLAPVASAAIGAPAVTLTPSTAAAGSTGNLGIDLKFAPTGGDTVKDLALALPAGLLANAAIDGGMCIKRRTPTSACQVGTGSVTASGMTLATTFDLVAPPKAGDLAGVVLLVNGSPLGSPGDVTVRPTGDPAGVGLDIAFSNIPNTYPVLGVVPVQISVTDIQSTFDGLRFPDSCPATPANVVVAADSYSDSTVQTASAPLKVTGCASLPYSPAFAVTAARDSSDPGVTLTTDVTETANQATSGSVALAFPGITLSPNIGVIELVCSDPTFSGCTPVGTATSTSPLYPAPLTGRAYLTGSLTAPGLTIVFPPPFSLKLTGKVELNSNSTTFQGLPDIPLTDLRVTLSGGPKAVFQSSCTTPSGTATAMLSSQNGDQSKSVSTPYAVSGCSRVNAGGPAGAGGKPRVLGTSVSGLANRKPALLLQLVAGKKAPLLSWFTITLPRGLSFVRHRVHGVLKLSGVSLVGAQLKSATLRHGQLTVTLRKAAASVIVSVSRRGLGESAGLRSQVRRHMLKSLTLTVVVRDAKGRQTTLPTLVKNVRPQG
jgi:hypothetical protein